MTEHDSERLWRDQLRQSPFTESHFTERLQRQIGNRAAERRPTGTGLRWRRMMIAALVVCSAGAAVFMLIPGQATPWFQHWVTGTKQLFTKERPMYEVDGHLLFQIYPDPFLAAGAPTGYMISFTAPFDTFEGKTLGIYARHLETGLQVEALKPKVIREPSGGYDSLQRFTAIFGLPLSGLWEYTIELDGRFYGDAVLRVGEPSWEVSGLFKTGNYTLRGIEGKVGFIDGKFWAGATQKYMWHFWGTEEQLSGPFKVLAQKKGTTELIEVFEAQELAGPNNGADRHVPSGMSLPEPGLWRLLVYVNDQLFDSIVVEVK